MDLRQYVENLRNEFAIAAEGADPAGRALAERLFTQLEAATRLMLLDALSDAADEITREIAPGSVHVRLRGREPAFEVTLAEPPTEDRRDASGPSPAPEPVLPPDGDDGSTSRINVRLPDHLKASIEEAASQAGLSVNAWIVRAAAGAIGTGNPDRRPTRRAEPQSQSQSGQRFTGWAR